MGDSIDRRYQVFVSSTFTDLEEERKAVTMALLKLRCLPAEMELFTATDEDQFEIIKKVIDDCDYYVLIVAGRYGTPASDGISYTEKEYRYAVEHEKHVLAFLHKNPQSIVAGKTESGSGARKLKKFREDVAKGRMVDFYTSADDLALRVTQGIANAIAKHPQQGWVRGREVSALELRVVELESQLRIAQEGAHAGPTPPQLPSELTERYVFPARMGYLRRSADPQAANEVAQEPVKIPTTWGQILSYTGTSFMHEAEYLWLLSPMSQLAQDVIDEDDSYRPPDFARANGVGVDYEVLDFVLAKMIAIGVVESVEKEGPLNARHWKLTDLGLVSFAAVMKKYEMDKEW